MDVPIEQLYSANLKRRQENKRYDRLVYLIERASKQHGIRVRPDALYLLANTIAEIVVDPMLTAYDMRPLLVTAHPVGEEELFSEIESDLDLIMDASRSVAKERDRTEISATSVIVALGRTIDKLKVNNTKLWGR